MKKLFIIFALLLVFTICALPVAADGEYANMQALWDHWVATAEDNALSIYPEGVCGVWCYGDMSRVTIMVTKDAAGRATRDEILSSLADSTGVDFTYGVYTHLELRQIQHELDQKCMNGELKDTGLCWFGVNEQNNYLMIGINTATPNAAAFMQEMFDKYQDRVAFEHCDGVFDYYIQNMGQEDIGKLFVADDSIDLSNGKLDNIITYASATAVSGGAIVTPTAVEPSYHWLLIPLTLLALAIVGALVLRSKRPQSAVLSTGEVIISTPSDIKAAVRYAAVTPSAALDARILDATKHNDN
ncbi:MAG: hypothetical protein IJY27_00540 [Clostridia bacterium]|nr:hypothetical protein [Clostridia bacterium]